MKRIDWVIFDLGGVLVEVDQGKIFDRLGSVIGLAPGVVAERLMAAREMWHDFTISEVTPSQLSRRVGELLGTQIDESVVIEAFNAELGPEISSTATILPALRTRTQVGCLSNTNSIHWDELLRSYAFMSDFDRRFASQLLGCAKPGREIYEKVIGFLRVKPQDVLFFDDREENVVAARQLGWNARIYTSVDSLESGLREFSLL